MTHKDLISQLSAAVSVDKDVAETLLLAVSDTLTEFCAGLDAVAIPGFGTFQPVKKEESIITDTESGKRKLLPPSIQVEFKSSVLLRKQFEG